MFSGCQRLFLGKNGRHRLNSFKFDPSLTNEMRRSLNLSDVAVNSANGARDFVTEILRPCYLQNGDNLPKLSPTTIDIFLEAALSRRHQPIQGANNVGDHRRQFREKAGSCFPNSSSPYDPSA